MPALARGRPRGQPLVPAADRPGRAARPSARWSWRCCSKRRPELVRLVAVLFSVATGALTVWLLAAFDTGRPRLPVRRPSTSWISDLGISWHLGVDGISLFLVVLTGILFPIAMLAGEPDARRRSRTTPGCCCSRPAAWASFLALDLFLFFVFFEIVLVPMYFLIGGWGHGNRVYAATEVLPLHDVRLGVHARRHRVAGRPDRHGPRAGPITFDLVELAETQVDRRDHRPAGSSWPSPSPSR